MSKKNINSQNPEFEIPVGRLCSVSGFLPACLRSGKGGMSGIELLQQLKEINNDTEVIVMTSYASVDTALMSLRLGA